MAGKGRQKEEKQVSGVVKFFFTLGVLAVLLFIGIFIYEKLYCGPSSVIDEYVDAFMAKSPSRVFRQLKLEPSLFVTPENLDKLLREKAEYDKITAYSLVPLTETEDGVKKYEIHYLMGRLESPFSQVITLKRSDDRFLYLFERWQIDNSGLTCSRITIRVPLGAELTVDGQKLPETGLRKKSGIDQDYELGSMFIGEHEFSVSLDGFLEYSGSFTVEAKDYMDEPIVTVRTGQMSPDAGNQDVAKQLVARIVPLLYESVLARRTYDYFLQQVVVESTTQAGLRPKYDALVEANSDPESHLTFVDFTDFQSKVSSVLSTDDCYAVRVNTTVKYLANYTVVENDVPDLVTVEKQKKIRTILHYSDGQWKLYDSTIFDKFG